VTISLCVVGGGDRHQARLNGMLIDEEGRLVELTRRSARHVSPGGTLWAPVNKGHRSVQSSVTAEGETESPMTSFAAFTRAESRSVIADRRDGGPAHRRNASARGDPVIGVPKHDRQRSPCTRRRSASTPPSTFDRGERSLPLHRGVARAHHGRSRSWAAMQDGIAMHAGVDGNAKVAS